MRRYKQRESTVTRDELVEVTCDGCGVAEGLSLMERLIPVVISINEGEEGGHVTELDYCDDCLVERGPAFVTAGAKAPYVTGEELPPGEDDD